MAHFVDVFRAPLYEGRLPDAVTVAVCIVWAIGALAVGSWVFVRKSHELAYTL
jgi:ABC-type polysaccharide/polyol phosphate export permease